MIYAEAQRQGLKDDTEIETQYGDGEKQRY